MFTHINVTCKNYVPIDCRQAERLICRNAHLVADGVFPDEFELFLRHFARLQFVMQVSDIIDWLVKWYCCMSVLQ